MRYCLAPRFLSLKLIENIDNCLNESDIGWTKERVTRCQLFSLMEIRHQRVDNTFNRMETYLSRQRAMKSLVEIHTTLRK